MPTQVKAYSVTDEKADPAPTTIERRDLRPNDVNIKIRWSGICFSDLHQAHGDWGNSMYPMTPGHEIIGEVSAVGSNVKNFKVGDKAGVGCMVDACLECNSCKRGHQQQCIHGAVLTYNSKDKEGVPTHGGYAESIVVREEFVLHVPESIYGPGAAPLLCAGATTYAPLVKHNIGPGKRVAVVGLGGLGHMALKLARSMGAEDVALFSRSRAKEAGAKELGANRVIVSSDEKEIQANARQFDVIIDTIPWDHDTTPYLSTLDIDGALVLVGYIGQSQHALNTAPLVFMDASISGSIIAGIELTQKLLYHCGEKNVVAEVEVTSYDNIVNAWERLHNADVKFRFVLDQTTL